MQNSQAREQRLIEQWYGESPGRSILQPLGWMYSLGMRMRTRAYRAGIFRTQRAGRPVIVVGNLTVGGTGKTPLVAWLAEQLSATGLRIGIVSRGYGRDTHAVQQVNSDCDWREVGDEPMLLWQRTGCDTVVARDRVAGARALVARGADVVIADDGLQHLRLARDCEIVVVDGARGFGNGRLLPAGPLRESLSRLKSGNPIVVINGAAEHASLSQGPGRLEHEPLSMVLQGPEAHRLDGLAAPRALQTLAGQTVHAVAGIGNPQRFFRHLRAFGLQLQEHAFPDHHPFSQADLTFGDGRPVFMTEKDAVRCRNLVDGRLWYVPVTASFTEPKRRELLQRIQQALAPSRSTLSA